MANGTSICPRCGRNNQADVFSPAYKMADAEKPSPFMSSPSLGGGGATSKASDSGSRLIGTGMRPMPSEPKPSVFTPTPSPAAPAFASTPAAPSYEPPTPVSSVPPSYAPPRGVAPAKKSKKKKETGRRIAGVIALCVFFACVLGIFRLLSDNQEYTLHWGEKTGVVDKFVKDELDGFCREHFVKASVKNNPDRNLPKFEPFIDENQAEVRIFTRYFHLSELGNMENVELACYFEDRLLRGIELRCEDGEALKAFFCEEFNVAQSEIDGVTETQYKDTRVVYFPQEKCIFFADAEGKECVEFLDVYKKGL
ncbi:MAG: hypothetical protein IKJ55_03780 [Clostridia bacterium]|nr:hypothetical protein [Clostridia bacterium]